MFGIPWGDFCEDSDNDSDGAGNPVTRSLIKACWDGDTNGAMQSMYGADINAGLIIDGVGNYCVVEYDDLQPCTALEAAVSAGNRYLVAQLLIRGAKRPDTFVMTWAVQGCDVDMLKLLIDSGGSVNSRDRLSILPFHTAVRDDVPDAVTYLLQQPDLDLTAVKYGWFDQNLDLEQYARKKRRNDSADLVRAEVRGCFIDMGFEESVRQSTCLVHSAVRVVSFWS